jgi:3-oxoacyl-[acyl-carrier protein] reductase
VALGPTETELFRENNPKGSEGEKRYLAKVPMARFASPEEIAAAIAFLAGGNAGFITGQTLFVDGGSSPGVIGQVRCDRKAVAGFRISGGNQKR